MSAPEIISYRRRLSPSSCTSRETPLLLAFRYMNKPEESGSTTSFAKGPTSLRASPPGGSTFTTSAPRSANTLPHIAPACPMLYSTTLMSDNAPALMFISNRRYALEYISPWPFLRRGDRKNPRISSMGHSREGGKPESGDLMIATTRLLKVSSSSGDSPPNIVICTLKVPSPLGAHKGR